MNVTWETDYLLRNSLMNEMRNLWKQQVYMSERGYGKNFWSEELDKLADILLELKRASSEFAKERVKEWGLYPPPLSKQRKIQTNVTGCLTTTL